MSCFPCFGKRKEKEDSSDDEASPKAGSTHKKAPDNGKNKAPESPAPPGSGNIQAQPFTFRELAQATKNFTPDCLLGEGGFGRVYKGSLENGGQVVAIKQLDRNSVQGNRDFLVEVLMLSLLHHPNLVNLVGYCADGDQRLLVHEFMTNGNLEEHLQDLPQGKQPMDWYTRMRIAYGAAQGLEYLHDKANPPVIYRDFKPSSILLDDSLTPKLSDFGLAKLNPMMGNKSQFSIMGSYGYSAPELDRAGEVTMKSDVYSFGVVLLELISGRRAIDDSKPTNEQNLVSWAQPMFKDQKRYPELVDPLLKGTFPSKSLNQIVAIVAMCLQEEASVRPMMADVVVTLSFLIDAPPTPEPSPVPTHDEAPHEEHRKSSSSESSDESEHVVETLQLGLNTRRGPESKPASRSSSRSGSSCSSRHSSRHGSIGRSSSKHNKRSFRQKSDATSSSKPLKEDAKRESDESSGSESSDGSSKQGSGVFLSLKLNEGSSKLGSGKSSSKRSQGSPHGSGGSRSGEESDDGSEESSSEGSEREYESD